MSSEAGEISTPDLIQALMSVDRVKNTDTFLILSMSGINLHDTVADIGCGPGFFTVPLAKYLVNGKLYALDIDEEMLAACRETVRKAQMGNVEVLKCGKFDFPLEPGSVNGVFLAFVVQQSADKPRFLRAVKGLVSPRGWCTILEWRRVETGNGPPLERRIDPKELQKLAEEAGFRPRGWRDLNPEQYMMMLRS